MNKTTTPTADEIRARLDELAIQKRETEAKWQRELKDAQAKAETIDARMKAADDPDEYKKLLREKTENEQFLEFLQNSKKAGRKPALDDTEFRAIETTINGKIDELQEEYAPKVKKAADELINILEDYYQRAYELDDITSQAAVMNHNAPSHREKIVMLASKCDDPLFYYRHICKAFFDHRGTVARLARAIKCNLKNPWYSGEEAQITNVLKERMKHGK